MANVTLNNVQKHYGDVHVIYGADFAIKDRKFVVFVGPSGCGMLTLLRMIAGLKEITGGELALDGAQAGEDRSFLPFAELKTIGLRALRHTLVSMHQRLGMDLNEKDLLAPLLEEVLVFQIVSAWPSIGGQSSPVARPSSNHIVKRALEYIENNLSRRISLTEIANAAGLGVRALQLAFQSEVGCSPITYLINRRLDRVHEALTTQTDLTIREIAKQWGFTHMSDFSRRYRERFGSSPSALRIQLK